MTMQPPFRYLPVLVLALGFFAQVAVAVAPDNDDFANPHTLDTSSTDTSTTLDATLATGEVIPTGYTAANYQGSVWWEWTPNFTSWHEITTETSAVSTVLAVWTDANGTGPLTLVHVNEGAVSRIYFYADSSVTYKISVASLTASRGEVTVGAYFRPDPPFSRVTAASFTPSSPNVTSSSVIVTADVTLQSSGEIASGLITLYSPTNTVLATATVSGAANRISGFVAQGVYRMSLTIPQGSAAGACRWGIALNRSSSTDTSSYGRKGVTPLPAGVPATITVVNTGPADPYGTWASGNTLSGGASARSADPDNDGISNLTEYECGLDPKSGVVPEVQVSGNTITQNGVPQIVFTGSGNSRKLRMIYLHRLGDPTVSLVVQFSNDATTWTPAVNAPVVLASNSTFEALAVDDDVLVSSRDSRFARVSYVYTP